MNIFVSYGHSDERWVKEGVERELIPWLRRQLQLDDVTIWADPRLSEHPSRKFREEIEREIDRAHIAILLISEDFTSSVFITTVELPRIKARIERGEMLLVAIQVGPMTKHGKKKIPWIYERQVLPSETKPLIDCVKDDAEFEYTRIQILEAIRNTLEDIRQRPSVTTPAESTAIYDSQLSSATSSNGSVLLDQGKVDDVASAVNRPIPEPSSVTSEPSSPVKGKRERGGQAHLYSCLVWMGKHHLVTVAAVTVLVLIAVAGIFYYDRVTDKGGDVPAADRVVSQTGEAVIEPPAPAEAVVEETIVPEVGHDFLESAFVWCPPGQFLCGDKWDAETIARKYGESAKWYKDAPQYTASISEGFWIAVKETTVSEFEAFVKETKYKTDAEKSGKGRVLNLLNEKWEEQPDANWRQPGWTIMPEQPVVLVSWNDAIAYCQWLGKKTGETYRLPMEKEWEYAGRAGTDTEFSWGDEISKGREYLNAADETEPPGGRNKWSSKFPFASGFFYVAPVGRFLPNKWGLYDMHGNVYEWCYDKYSKYPSDNTDSPSGLTTAKSDRVSRGGSWRCGPGFCRSAFRNHGPEDSADSFTGFRIVRASSSPRTEPESKPITSKPESDHEAATPISQKDSAPVPIPSDDVDVPPEVREAVMKALQEIKIEKGTKQSGGF